MSPIFDVWCFQKTGVIQLIARSNGKAGDKKSELAVMILVYVFIKSLTEKLVLSGK